MSFKGYCNAPDFFKQKPVEVQTQTMSRKLAEAVYHFVYNPDRVDKEMVINSFGAIIASVTQVPTNVRLVTTIIDHTLIVTVQDRKDFALFVNTLDGTIELREY